VQDEIDRPVDLERLADVVLEQGEGRIVEEVRHVGAGPRHQVVHGHHPVAPLKKPLTQV
jgi:hypothetical protein